MPMDDFKKKHYAALFAVLNCYLSLDDWRGLESRGAATVPEVLSI